MSKIVGVLILGLAGMYIGTYLAIGLALDTFIQLTEPEQPVFQELGASEGQTKVFPDVQLQKATSVQGTVGIE